MYTKMYKNLSEQVEKILIPYARFNQMMAKNVEELTGLSLASMQARCDIGNAHLHALGEVKDLSSLAAFNAQQLESLLALSRRCVEDCSQFTEIARAFRADIEMLMTENAARSRTGS
ncbi:phasin family protein [Citrobacter sp. NCU1]|uniref:phasin family protein n=1 Tax=Citrobacter sp. NCU1 TaxID=2026683 RepID=UPI001391C8D8|nr:phasin family protein [Citrobacter sp. NCU1]NDO82197.1 phasin family protein [Citrobacter sp. NCU1]